MKKAGRMVTLFNTLLTDMRSDVTAYPIAGVNCHMIWGKMLTCLLFAIGLKQF